MAHAAASADEHAGHDEEVEERSAREEHHHGACERQRGHDEPDRARGPAAEHGVPGDRPGHEDARHDDETARELADDDRDGQRQRGHSDHQRNHGQQLSSHRSATVARRVRGDIAQIG